MGILDFFKPDPSRKWKVHHTQAVVLDLVRMSLNGIQLGESVWRLQSLGRPSNSRPFRHNRFVYEKMGVVVESEEERIISFGLPIVHDDLDQIGPCILKVLFPSGKRIRVTPTSQVNEWLNALGPPQQTDTGPDEIVFFLSVAGKLLELECTPDAYLRRVNLFLPGD